MPFIKHTSKAIEYQGESFTKSLGRKDASLWLANEQANYKLFDPTGTSVSTGALVKSGDNLTMTLSVPSADTATLEGICLLLVYQTDDNDATINDVIAEYFITYKKPNA